MKASARERRIIIATLTPPAIHGAASAVATGDNCAAAPPVRDDSESHETPDTTTPFSRSCR